MEKVLRKENDLILMIRESLLVTALNQERFNEQRSPLPTSFLTRLSPSITRKDRVDDE